jgi:DNA mismatch repair protein MutS
LPRSVLVRAEELLRVLEADEDAAPGARARPQRAAPSPAQLSLFQPMAVGDAVVLEALRTLDIERTSPLEALTLLADWKRRLS